MEKVYLKTMASVKKTILIKKKSAEPKVIVPPTKNIFAESLRNDKIFLEDKHVDPLEKPIKKSFISKTLKSTKQKPTLSREERLEMELNDKNNQINSLLSRQNELESSLALLKEFKLKQEENEKLIKRKNSLEDKLAITNKVRLKII